MNVKWIVIVVAIGAFFGIVGMGYFLSHSSEQAQSEKKLSVVTSFYPLYFLASEIGGDKATVTTVVPAGVEPHEYEPTPHDMVAIESADILVLNGAGFEGWASDVENNVMGRVAIVHAGEHVATQRGVDEGGHEVTDPHVWLSPQLMLPMVDMIVSEYVTADPSNAAYYRANAEVLQQQLAALDGDYRARLNSCKKNEIVTSHAAFGYMASSYGLTQVPIAGISTEEEPSAQALARIADFAKKHNVTHIFFETLVSPAFAETIAREVGAQTAVLNPIEGLTQEESAAGKNYLTEMRENLNQLTIALQCQ